MNCKQNQKINQVKESTLVVGIDIGSTTQYARALNDLSSTISFIENMNVGNSTLVTCKRYIHFLRTILYY